MRKQILNAGEPDKLCMRPQVRVVRIFNTYGPHMALDDGRVVSNFVAQAGCHFCSSYPL